MQDFMKPVHPEWHTILNDALCHMDAHYLNELQSNHSWLPGAERLFNAFSLPLSATHYILLGESPYPRAESANGYAFWDDSVDSLWSPTGLSKSVNRATSLRHWMKMLLYARGDLTNDFSQAAIAGLDKRDYLKTAPALFKAFIKRGFLLLNASLVYSKGAVNQHARQWRPFMHHLFQSLAERNHAIPFILFGQVAKRVPEAELFPTLIAEHPYNLSFITNPDVVDFFRPLDLLAQHDEQYNR